MSVVVTHTQIALRRSKALLRCFAVAFHGLRVVLRGAPANGVKLSKRVLCQSLALPSGLAVPLRRLRQRLAVRHAPPSNMSQSLNSAGAKPCSAAMRHHRTASAYPSRHRAHGRDATRGRIAPWRVLAPPLSATTDRLSVVLGDTVFAKWQSLPFSYQLSNSALVSDGNARMFSA